MWRGIPEDILEIHPHDAEVRGIRNGQMVSIASRVGATTLRALISERMAQGVVYTTFHHPVSGANVITTENSDWATNCPEYKVTAVQVTFPTSNPTGRRTGKSARMKTSASRSKPLWPRSEQQIPSSRRKPGPRLATSYHAESLGPDVPSG